jgi:2-(1,2-epoxy-1,2-dihydrophenyl)acetyl-CoA isomerase
MTVSEDDAPLLVVDDGRLRILTLNRPDRLNALTPDLHHRLRDAVRDAAENPSVGALAITGAGRAFCAGGDVKAARDQAAGATTPETVEERADVVRRHGQTVQWLQQMPKPTLAIVNGAAAGAGLALALACDLRLASTLAVFRVAYAGVALSGDLGISSSLRRLVGPARARELMFLDETIDAEKAAAFGLVNRLFDASNLGAAFDIARTLAAGPTLAFRYMKQNLDLAATASLDQVVEREAYNTARCVRSLDVKEATAAIRERRPPQFQGR